MKFGGEYFRYVRIFELRVRGYHRFWPYLDILNISHTEATAKDSLNV